MNYLDFDNVIKTPVSFYRGNHYDKTFHVIKNGIDYDWSGVEDIIVLARKDKKSATNVLELKKSSGDIEITTGYMTWHLTSTKTNIEPGDYDCFEVVIVFAGGKVRLWWDAKLRVKWRAYDG